MTMDIPAFYSDWFVGRFSFIDIAASQKVAANLDRGGIKAREFLPGEMEEIAERIGELAKGWGIKAATCGEIKDLERFGIEHNRCIDDRLIVKCFSHDAELMKFVGARFVSGDPLLGVPDRCEPGDYRKDKGQRAACGCIMSKDIGEYNTCPHLCHYCYANANNDVVSVKKKYWPSENEMSHESYCLRGRIVELEFNNMLDMSFESNIICMGDWEVESGLENQLAACWDTPTNILIESIHAYYVAAIKAGSIEAYFRLGRFNSTLALHCESAKTVISNRCDVDKFARENSSKRYGQARSYYEWVSSDYMNIACRA